MENVSFSRKHITDHDLLDKTLKEAINAGKKKSAIRFLASVGEKIEDGSDLTSDQRAAVLEILAESLSVQLLREMTQNEQY